MPGKQLLDFTFVHLLADFVTHPPSSFVGHSKLPLEFFSAYTVACRDKQIDRIEPNLERCSCILKDGACRGIDVIPASRTSPSATVAHSMESAFSAAGPTNVTLTKADLEDKFKASLIVRETFEEIADAEIWEC